MAGGSAVPFGTLPTTTRADTAIRSLQAGGRVAQEQDWTASLREIIEQMEQSGVMELEVREAGLRIRLRRHSGEAAPDRSSEVPDRAGDSTVPLGQNGSESYRVVAPLTGIYYAAPNASAPPYIEVGDWVEESSVVGLIETMKVFNEVTAECRGRVVSLLTYQGQLVQAGDPIAVVDTAAMPDSAGEAER